MEHHDCIFCRIAAQSAPAFLLCEDRHSLAFMDINPAAPGHALVISKAHAETLFDIPLAELQAVMATVQRVARAIDATLRPDGISILQANGPGAAQSVGHFHMHILPRSLYDDLPMNWLLNPGNRHAIEATATQLRAALSDIE